MELDKLRQIIVEVLRVDPGEIEEKTRFVEDLCADSLDVYQIIMGIEEDFEVEIPVELAEQVRTVGDAIELIRKVNEPGSRS